MTYISLSDYLKSTFGCKVYRLSLSTGCTCPNRDGSAGFGGCIFCSEGGSGDFASPFLDMDMQIENAKGRVDSKFSKSIPKDQRKYIAYFQSFTNTYGSVDYLEPIFLSAARRKEIVAISIGTRPDCLDDDIMEMLCRLNKIKPVWIELGLQTIHESTANFINRAYSLQCFEDSYNRLKKAGIYVIVHVIAYLPGENEEMMLESAKYLSNLNPVLDGIKVSLLHVLKGTRLSEIYHENKFYLPTMEEYCAFIPKFLSLLNPKTVVHRLTGDGPKKILEAPLWTGDKKKVLNCLKKYIEEFNPPK